MLDSELSNYIHKPVAFAGVSNGIFGGARAIEALTITVREMGMVATFSDVYFPQVQNLFDEKGEIKDEAFVKRIQRGYTELIWMAKSLKWEERILKVFITRSEIGFRNSYFSGSENENVDPLPSTLSTHNFPRCVLTISKAIYNPRPRPLIL